MNLRGLLSSSSNSSNGKGRFGEFVDGMSGYRGVGVSRTDSAWSDDDNFDLACDGDMRGFTAVGSKVGVE
jgi:hypothetical protein